MSGNRWECSPVAVDLPRCRARPKAERASHSFCSCSVELSGAERSGASYFCLMVCIWIWSLKFIWMWICNLDSVIKWVVWCFLFWIFEVLNFEVHGKFKFHVCVEDDIFSILRPFLAVTLSSESRSGNGEAKSHRKPVRCPRLVDESIVFLNS